MQPKFDINLNGQVAIVTGASAGLGQRFAKCLAATGAKVALVARRAEKLEGIVADIRKDGGQAMAFPADMADAESLTKLVDDVEEALGLVTILVNNAGMVDAKYATKMPDDLIDRLLAVNVRAPYILSREVAKKLIAAKKPGRIVNISSMSAYNYSSSDAASMYSISKAAVARMTEVLAVEWVKFHINVNAIAPGAFRSEMMEEMIERVGDPSEHLNRKRLGEPDQLDSTLLYLVSPSSDFVTGTIVKCDDGQYSR